MNIAYVDFYGDSKTDKSSSGVERKIAAQIKMLETLGKVTRHSYDTQSGGKAIKHIRMVTRRLPFFPSKIAYSYDSSYADLDAMYFRRTTLDSCAVRFFRDVKKYNPACKIVMEIPTYPYDKEMASLVEWPRLIKDRWNRKKLKKYIDRIITFSDDNEIFGIPTIKTLNGLDFDTVPIRKISYGDDGVIHAIMVANFAPWHGLDRVIEGMVSYQRHQESSPFVLHVVGSGKEVEIARYRINGTKVGDWIIFHGNLTGPDLDMIYNLASISFDVFGNHRQGITLSSSLKSREYAAKGLPIVGSAYIDFFGKSNKHFLLFPANDVPLDILKIVDFYHSLCKQADDCQHLAEEIRAYAKARCDISVTMAPILYFLEGR